MPRKPVLTQSAPRNTRELNAYQEVVKWCFRMNPDYMTAWTKRIGKKNMRVLRRDGEVIGGLGIINVGQYFGGRRLDMAAIAAVGVDPEHRAGGVATHLMRELIVELHRKGVPLSTLYPATLPVYRRAGYELAGSFLLYRMSMRFAKADDRKLTVRLARNSDTKKIRALYEEQARATDGHMARIPEMWDRFVAKGRDARTVVITRKGEIEGYVIAWQRRPAGSSKLELLVADFNYRTPAAHRRIWTWIADHKTLVDEVYWVGGAVDAFQMPLRDQNVRVHKIERWMLRIVDLKKALTGRGYPAGLEAEVPLDVTDDLIAANRGRFVLRISGGKATVVKGGGGLVSLDIRAFAALYSGYLPPKDLEIKASAKNRALLVRIFAGPTPWMADDF